MYNLDMDNLSKIQQFLGNKGVKYQLKHYSETAKNAREASVEIDIPQSSMLKTLLVKDSGSFNLLLIPSPNQVNFVGLNKRMKASFSMATLQEVEETTGYMIGSVSPFCLKNEIPIYIEGSCLNLHKVGVGSGVKGIEIVLNPKDLQVATGAKVAKLI